MTPSLQTAETLRQAGRQPALPFQVALANGKRLTLRRLLRILPGKRLTGVGDMEGRPVLAKLFIATQGSERHWARERGGVEALTVQQIPVPRMLDAGALQEGGHYLLLEFLEGAQDLSQSSAAHADACEILGRMHAKGLAQADAHLGNFLQWRNGLYVIDGDAIRTSITNDEAVDNLALLLAQLPPNQDIAPLVAAYHSGNPTAVIDLPRLMDAMTEARKRRLKDYLGKCLRDCSLFKVEKHGSRFMAVAREDADYLAPIVADPDRWIEHGTPLKQGRTTTLALIEHAEHKLVIKRYNIKGVGHALSRCWRPSRAWHSWVEAHRLAFLGIATPRPLALVEQRTGPLRGKAWLITDYCPGNNLVSHLAPYIDAVPPTQALEAIRQLFRQLSDACISHGDLKATNLIWHEGQIRLIDLDAMRQHTNIVTFTRARRKDHERFLRNWPGSSVLHRALSAVLTTV